jgi:hypothetical protein
MKVFAFLACFSVPSLVLGQSLGDAAQKEKERRKKTDTKASPAPVFTNESLGTTKGQLANDPNAPPPPQDRLLGPESGDSKQEEASWRQRVAAAQARLTKAKQHNEESQRRVVVPHMGYVPLQNAQAQAESAKAELDKAQQALDELLEAARRANVPPGWLR